MYRLQNYSIVHSVAQNFSQQPDYVSTNVFTRPGELTTNVTFVGKESSGRRTSGNTWNFTKVLGLSALTMFIYLNLWQKGHIFCKIVVQKTLSQLLSNILKMKRIFQPSFLSYYSHFVYILVVVKCVWSVSHLHITVIISLSSPISFWHSTTIKIVKS